MDWKRAAGRAWEESPAHMAAMRTEMKETCGNCRFFNAEGNDCRRRAPLQNRWWPTVIETDWCGEWENDFRVVASTPTTYAEGLHQSANLP